MSKGYKYDIIFRKHAVALLRELRFNGVVFFSDNDIDNVNDLVEHLGISKYSLYKWDKELSPSEVGYNSGEYGDVENVERDFPLEFETKEDKMDTDKLRFYSWLGSNLGIPKSSSLLKEQLILKIGLKFIEMSGLIQNGKYKELMERLK